MRRPMRRFEFLWVNLWVTKVKTRDTTAFKKVLSFEYAILLFILKSWLFFLRNTICIVVMVLDFTLKWQTLFQSRQEFFEEPEVVWVIPWYDTINGLQCSDSFQSNWLLMNNYYLYLEIYCEDNCQCFLETQNLAPTPRPLSHMIYSP